MKDKFPLISIITVVYNDALGLEKTIQSVINQPYDNVDPEQPQNTYKIRY